MDEIPTILACDVGNSTISLANVTGRDVTDVRVVRIGELASLGDVLKELWGENPGPSQLVASSVNPAALKALEASASETIDQKTLVVGRDLPLPIATDLPDPQTIGVDRLCCAAAAFDRLGTACVIADFGTAITIDCVNDEGVFLGGAILPGLAMSTESLSANTSKLPRVELTRPDWVFGKDTTQAIGGGIVYGARGALRELVEAYATELKHWPTVIATGGDAKLICSPENMMDIIQAIVPDLALRGAAMAYYKFVISNS